MTILKVVLSYLIYDLFIHTTALGFHIASPFANIKASTPSSSSLCAVLNPESKYFQLEEMEDQESCTTEIFLGKDGEVSVWETNGPPPVRSSGTWSVSDDDIFQMNIVRTYGSGQDSRDVGEFEFDVSRTFIGSLSLVGEEIGIEGSMHLMDEFTGDMEVGFFSMIDTTAAKLGEESI